MIYQVYKTTNIVNDKIYIGVHKTRKQINSYLGSGKLLKRAVKKYGESSFNKEILFEFKTEKEAFKQEAELVNDAFVARTDTYNLKLGGYGGWDHFTDYQRRNERISKVRDYSSEKYIKARSTIAKKSNRTRIKNGEKMFGGKHDGFKGKSHSDETKRKMSESSKGSIPWNQNKKWFHNITLKQSKMIGLNEIQAYTDNGWLKGRKMKFS